jgi:hypothetical protein
MVQLIGSFSCRSSLGSDHLSRFSIKPAPAAQSTQPLSSFRLYHLYYTIVYVIKLPRYIVEKTGEGRVQYHGNTWAVLPLAMTANLSIVRFEMSPNRRWHLHNQGHNAGGLLWALWKVGSQLKAEARVARVLRVLSTFRGLCREYSTPHEKDGVTVWNDRCDRLCS